jgi:glycosyltransferase involved in cell wall biosynthesis
LKSTDFGHTHFILTNSTHLAKEYIADFHLKHHRISNYPYGIDTRRYCPSNGTSSPFLGANAQTPTILSIGRIEYPKGSDVLFDALREAHQEYPALRAIFLGRVTDPLQGIYHSFMRDAPFWVWHPGEVPHTELPRLIASADIFAFPSRDEPFGRVLLEAMSSGLPVVGSCAGGIPEIVQDGETGFLVNPGDSHALAERILMLCRNSEQRCAMGKKAREEMIRRFDLGRVVEGQIKVYEELLGQRSMGKQPVYGVK